MKTMPSLTLEHTSKYFEWVEIVLYLSSADHLNVNRLNEWSEIFRNVTVIAPENVTQNDTIDVEWITVKSETFKADLWNAHLEQSEAEWILFLEDGEEVEYLDFPSKEEINKENWPPVLLKWKENEVEVQQYKMRFIPGGIEDVFGGRELPDCTRYITENDVRITNNHIQLKREGTPIGPIDTSIELGISDFAPRVYLLEGHRYLKEKEFVYATAQFRQLLKRERLLPFDRLGAVNGMASCLAEQYKWDRALSLAQQSLDAEPFQNLPYLIQYRIYQLQQKWEEAYKALNRYYDRFNLQSSASFDIILSIEESLVNLSDLALKAGLRKQASEHLEELFAIRNGDVDAAFLKKNLLLSIELQDLKKSRFYFKQLFGDLLEQGELSESIREEMDDFTTLFMKNEWFELVFEIYEQLHEKYPEDGDFKRRLIVTSIKTNRMEKARSLASKVA